jgi:cobalt/nickel transport protein
MLRFLTCCLTMLAGYTLCGTAALAAPLGVLIPAASIITTTDAAAVTVQFAVIDPLTRRLEMAKPQRLAVQHLGEPLDLLARLKPATTSGSGAPTGPGTWSATFTANRPGDYTVYGQTAPLWQAADELFVVLATKVCVNVAGLEEGWDEPVGLELEIVPLTRPYGLWAGNLFSGQVLARGEPAPYVEVAISRYEDLVTPPLAAGLPGAYTVQKLRADSNGVFHYAMPRSGWWGFTAQSEAEWVLDQGGREQPVLLGAGYWVQARELP